MVVPAGSGKTVILIEKRARSNPKDVVLARCRGDSLFNPDAKNPKARKAASQKEHGLEMEKNYRVWDANRKIFVYQENSTEPEPRLAARFRLCLSELELFIRRRKHPGKSLPLVRRLPYVLIGDERQ